MVFISVGNVENIRVKYTKIKTVLGNRCDANVFGLDCL